MTAPAPFDDYPLTFPSHSRAGAPEYRMRRDCFAGVSGAGGTRGMTVLESLPGEGLCVYAGAPPATDAGVGLRPRPAYSLSADDPPAVPSGRVFVQGAAGAGLAQAVAALGYAVESVPPYAPDAAWIVAGNGSIAAALVNLKALMAVGAIVSAEPQMLRPLALR